MELYQTDLHYILLDGEKSLWCNRTNGRIEPKKGSEFHNAWEPVYLGQVYGIIGKVKLHPESDWRLLLIKRKTEVCVFGGEKQIYKINKIVVLPLNSEEVSAADLELDNYKSHPSTSQKVEKVHQSHDNSQLSLRGTWNSIKSAAENVKSKKKESKESKERDKFERRILDELLKMYNGSDFFYYSNNFDLTTCLQRQKSPEYDNTLPLWKRADERFFWNKHMLLELMELGDPQADYWIIPVIQGYVQMEKCIMDFNEDKQIDMSSSVDFPSRKLEPLGYNISIISRRSRHRAGTRSRKRGINASGACANYVETEQIIEFAPHLVSFVQVRGSIPVFWSQSGVKYRPPPRLDKDEESSHAAFCLHMEEQLRLYQKVAVISLAELAGKEHVIGDAFLGHTIEYNSPKITYVTFDFHEYCRGMRFENVSILTEGINDIIKDMRYTWMDSHGMICEQRGVFRVNCVDCLDRTNVVQTAIARIVMETQFRKLGLLPPEENLPGSCRRTYQQLWANNGDIISQQYAGTAALKGDYTRTGERKFTGMMKDGVNSANRYYLRFRDAYRQAAIDLTLGQPVSEDLLVPVTDTDEVDANEMAEKEENVRAMIEDCKRMLIVEPEQCLGGWALINADPIEGDSDRQDMDIILLLSQRSVYVVWYSEEDEEVNRYQRIYLEDVDKIEIGMEPALFKSKYPCMRVYYHYLADEGLFHMFRTPTLRLFNNKATTVVSHEEAKETLRLIASSFRAAQQILSLDLEIVEKQKLERKKLLPHPEIMDIHQQQQENSLVGINLPRDVSAEMDPSRVEKEAGDKEIATLTAIPRRGEQQESSRSKSPLSFLNNLPKPNFNKVALNPGKFSLQMPNMRKPVAKLNIQNLNLLRRLKQARGSDRMGNVSDVDGGKYQEDVSDLDREAMENSLIMEEDVNREVVFESCGILATSPKQLLVSKRHLSVDKTFKSIDEDSAKDENIHQRRPASTEEDIIFRFDPEHGLTKDDVQKSKNKGYGEIKSEDKVKPHDIEQRVGDCGEQEANELQNATDQKSDVKVSQNLSKQEPSQLAVAPSASENIVVDDDEFCIVENDEVQAIFSKSQYLYHPHMKVSLSDTTISSNLLPDSITTSQREGDSRDTSLVSRLKLKMSNLSRPLTPKSQESAVSRTHIRKSQRAMEVFEQLIHEKLPSNDCKSRYIFI